MRFLSIDFNVSVSTNVQLRKIFREFLSEKISVKRLRRVLFYIWILFSDRGGAVSFSNKPFKRSTGHSNSSNVDDLQVRCGLM